MSLPLDRTWSFACCCQQVTVRHPGRGGFDKLLISQAISRIKESAPTRKHTLAEEPFPPTPIRKEQETMTSTPCRRDLLLMAAAGVAAAPALALTSTPTLAYQGNMERALSALEAAMQSLQAATPNKGGHRERAMRIIEHAMGGVQAGIDFAYQHGGGGY
jgi:hypothetical protein